MADSNQHNDDMPAAGGQTLASHLLAPEPFAGLVADYKSLIETRVKQKGAVLRTTYRMAQKVNPDLAERMMRDLLPELVHNMEPFYADYCRQDELNFRDYIMAHETPVAGLIMNSADARAQNIKKRALQSGYERVRGSIRQLVEADMAGIADIMARHM